MNVIRSEKQPKLINHGSFGATIKIGPKSHVSLSEPGYSVLFNVPVVEVLIGIGKDHTATLLMDQDAWEALKAGEKPQISTLKEFKENFL